MVFCQVYFRAEGHFLIVFSVDINYFTLKSSLLRSAQGEIFDITRAIGAIIAEIYGFQYYSSKHDKHIINSQ